MVSRALAFKGLFRQLLLKMLGGDQLYYPLKITQGYLARIESTLLMA
ncbi:MAG TPA: hypothetical protein VE177_07845 [Candidatus Binatus sp.]|nr:hypothetical protein [Candidatus Binatus sp.]